MSTAPPSFPPEQVTEAIRAGLSQRENVALEPGEAAALTDTYLGNLDHYRQHVQKSLADGDYRQAAEKSWGAYAQAIKLIGAEHGLHVNSHTAPSCASPTDSLCWSIKEMERPRKPLLPD